MPSHSCLSRAHCIVSVPVSAHGKEMSDFEKSFWNERMLFCVASKPAFRQACVYRHVSAGMRLQACVYRHVSRLARKHADMLTDMCEVVCKTPSSVGKRLATKKQRECFAFK